jgi:hypothetical protein
VNKKSPLSPSVVGYTKPEAVKLVVTLRLLRAASEPDIMTFFQFGISCWLGIAVSYIYMPYISLLPLRANNTVYLI